MKQKTKLLLILALGLISISGWLSLCIEEMPLEAFLFGIFLLLSILIPIIIIREEVI
jgi:hypothetical protein